MKQKSKHILHSFPLFPDFGIKRAMLLILSFFILHSSFFILTSCGESEDTSPSLADTDRMEQLIDRSIPRIADFSSKYGTYILYDFNQELDFAYQFQQATNWQNAKLEQLTKQEAAEAVDYLYDNFFLLYSNDFKAKYFPRKLLLVNSIKAQTLGVSEPDEFGYHNAASNINSMTIAFNKAKMNVMTDKEKAEYLQSLNYVLLGGYLVSVRADYPVDDSYFSYSLSYYASLMDPKRTQARFLSDEFFYNKGFFRPDEDESTYFVSAEEDLIAFTRVLVHMDKEMHDLLIEYPLMAEKMHFLAAGLQSMGVDVLKVNPWVEDFLAIENASVKPMISVAPIVTTTTDAVANITFSRGAHDFAKAEVLVNGALAATLDLSDCATAAKFTKSVEITGLEIGANAVEVRVYEAGRTRPSQTATIVASYVNMKNIERFVITNSEGGLYKFYEYKDYDYAEGKNVPGMTTVRFVKSPTEVDWNTGIETGGITRYWKIMKESGRVTKIIVVDETIDYVAYKPIHEVIATYDFIYNEYGELESANRNGEPFVTDVVYANGDIIRYSYEGKPYFPVYASAEGRTARVDCLDANMSGHCFNMKGDEDANPYYISGLPSVIPGTEAEIPLQLLYSQYLFSSLEGVWNAGWVMENGTNYTVVDLGNITWTYTFILK